MSDEPEEPPLAPVVRIRAGVDLTDEEPPLAEHRRDPGEEPFCNHWRLETHRESRRVYCRDCKREVPAFDALEEIRRHWDRFIIARNEAERRAGVARANLEELLRAEANAKARIRNARKRGDPEIVQALRDLVRLVKSDRRRRGVYDVAGDELAEGLQTAEVALYRHGQQRAREGEEPPIRGTAPPAAEGEAF